MDLDTLLVSLLQLTEMTRATAKELAAGTGIEFKISAPERGSFVIDLEVLQEIGKALVAIAPQIPSIIKAVLDFLQIKKLLKGDKPDRTESKNGKTTIIKGNSQVIVADKVFQIYGKNEAANTALSKLFAGMEDRPEIEDLEITAPGIGEFSVSSDEFPAMARRNQMIDDKQTKEIKRTEMSLLKIVFQRDRMWDFVWEGLKISAFITDTEFWDRVDSFAARFGRGDQFLVDLEILKTWDTEANCMMNEATGW